ncbi:MAG: GNAT family N-acetyltransferase [candidate division KSB1 bacterium]|nr:GNAT family N-acetyltransferase [candidate division KSB1 bacterium]MDZ7274879.1 GNAT family N-acetyltransferase [candidate division KSB1 bacterium]MDZ7286669.1 GNAT family N-acetyltransferase [candidate division KSB1 bacterium]MDZ7299168.1 GNAT family N-acetyltransferase [candidate division KSB1 bacterium]MDZ7307022.1 GNAT family N-acetyltransferase [candidate division KSB1 bacterium]
MNAASPKTLLPVTITYLEMLAPPARPAPPPRPEATIMHAQHPTVSFYRYLYNTVGAAWNWIDRRKLSDAALAAIIQHPQVEVHVLYVAGVPAGYAELDFRRLPEVELAYFGLLPEFLGRGWGSYLLDASLRRAWQRQPVRVWLHTCTLDHPQALAFYQKAGFVPFRRETTMVEKLAGESGDDANFTL